VFPVRSRRGFCRFLPGGFFFSLSLFLPVSVLGWVVLAACLPACLPAASVSAAAACCRFACFSSLRCFAASWLSRRWLSLFGYLMIPFSVQQQFVQRRRPRRRRVLLISLTLEVGLL
jgi:hypothetical protein